MTRPFLLAGLVAALFAALAAAVEVPVPARLLAEFRGAYPEDARPDGRVVTFDLVAAEAIAGVVDGQPIRVWAYNGRVPGPELRVRLGDTVRVRLTNRLAQPTTIHWHGVRVPNDMDGVPTPLRPPIAPGETFTYEFTPKDAGTFWYHPHHRSSEQVERGLYGVLIVEDRGRPWWDRELVWVVDDWRLLPDMSIDPQFNTRHDLAHDGRWGNAITVNGETSAVVPARGGERLRLRIVNVANGRVFASDFGALPARVVAVDGLYARTAVDASGLELAPGNRIDVDLVVPEEPGRYPIVDRFLDRFPHRLLEVVVEGREGKRRKRATDQAPTGEVPAWREGLAVPATAELALDARAGGPFGIEWTIDGQAFPHHGMVALPLGEWSRLRFVNRTARLHPMHLHGMFFKLLGRNGLPVDEPFFRDTVLIHGWETVDLGVVPLDAGSWMLHCHVLEHAEAGMMTMVEVAPRPAQPAAPPGS